MKKRMKRLAALSMAVLMAASMAACGGSGGEIGLLQDGDLIEIDIPNASIQVKLSDAELEERRKQYIPPAPKVTSGWLARYSRIVSAASKGAVMQ